MLVKKLSTVICMLLSFAAVGQNAQNPTTRTQGYLLADIVENIASNLNKTIVAEPSFDAQESAQVYGKTLSELNYGDLLGILKLHGYTATEAGDVINIVDISKMRNQALPIVVAGESYFPDQYVTKVINLDKPCAVLVLPMLRPMLAQYAHMTAMPDSNVLVIADNFANIQRIEIIVAALENATKKKQDCRARLKQS